MASGYQAVESDEQADAENGGLQFKSFLGTDSGANGGTGGQQRTGYYQNTAPSGSSGFWTVEYYQKYFDVDTKTVLRRCYTTLLPTSSDYLTSHTTPSPDLYGPFWTLTTLIFSLFVFSSFAASLVYSLSTEGSKYQYDFTLLSVAVTLVYSYGLGLPALLWIGLRYLGVSAEEWSVVEAIAAWGYGMFVWIPVSLLCVIPVAILRWVLVGVAFGVSGYFLFANVYPIIRTTDQKSSRLIIPILVVLHAAVALTFKVLFFSYYVTKELGPKDPIPGTPSEEDPGTGPGMLIRRLFM